MWRDIDIDGMRVPKLHDEPIVRPLRRGLLQRCTVPDADQEERHGKALRHSGDGVGDEGAGGAPHLALLLDEGIFDGDGEGGGCWVVELDEGEERECCGAFGPGNGEARWCSGELDFWRIGNGFTADVGLCSRRRGE